jgi:2-phosphosulfolactate phosphatase
VLERIDIAMTPAEALLLPVAGCYVVIDALRATTTIAALFHDGLKTLRVLADVDAAREYRSQPGTLLFGEEGGLRPEGFDYGNSPAEAAAVDVDGRDAVLVTSNGTVALCAVANRGVTVAGSLANLSAVARFASRHARVMVVCAGNGGARRFSLEDFAVAAAFVRQLSNGAPSVELGDAALLGSRVAAAEELMRASEHAGVTRRLGFAADVEYAVQRDIAPCVPMVDSFGDGWAVLKNRV